MLDSLVHVTYLFKRRCDVPYGSVRIWSQIVLSFPYAAPGRAVSHLLSSCQTPSHTFTPIACLALVPDRSAGVTICGLQFENCSGVAIQLQGTKPPNLKSPGLTLVHTRFVGSEGSKDGSKGGDVYSQGAALNICSCRFRDSFAGEGGALYLSNSRALIRHSLFYNTTQNYGTGGGAISIRQGSNVKLVSSTFAYNEAMGGSAIDMADASLEVLDCTFMHSRVASAISVIDPVKFSVTNSSFRNCSSKGVGGAVTLAYSTADASEAVFEGVTFEDCRAKDQGGAIYAGLEADDAEASISIKDSTFTGCEVGAMS